VTIVITGASGFIGKSLNNYLSNEGFDCIGVSRTPCPEAQIVNDYSESPTGDVLIHCAECNDRNWVNNHSNDTYASDVAETLNSLIEKNFRQVIYFSSSVVYGSSNGLNSTKDKVFSYDKYSEVKISSENIVAGINGCILRLANIYGPGMSKKNVISDILSQLSNKETISLISGSPIRDFLHIVDLMSAVKEIIVKKKAGKYNIGSGEGISIKNLAELIIKLNKSHQRLNFSKDKPIDSKIILDISNTLEELDWKPQISLKDGLTDLINYKLCQVK